jgi:hypothetical protein
MKKLITCFRNGLLTTLLLGSNAWGGPILPADIVTVGDREWAQPDLFLDLSWNDIDAVCPGGICNGSLNGLDLNGWTWAEDDDTTELARVYLAAAGIDTSGLTLPDYGDSPGSTWAQAFEDDFRATSDPNPGYHDYFSGGHLINKVGSPIIVFGYAMNAVVCSSCLHPIWRGELEDNYTIQFFTQPDSRVEGFGAWFYRDSSNQVPVPATPVLMITALLLLLRKRQWPASLIERSKS